MPTGKLNALRVKNLALPGRYGDGGGLWLQVRDANHRSWMFRFTLNGRSRWMGLGPVEDITLAEARDAARDARRLLLEGVDPLERRQQGRAAAASEAQAHTFKQVAEMYIAAHQATWKNEKHRAQWTSTLGTYAYPALGGRRVAGVETGDVMRVLEPIWREKPETASRLRGRIESVLDYAKARGWRAGDNPARWRGHVENLLPKRNKVQAVEHHAALPWREIAAFMLDLKKQDGIGALALQFTILSAARTGEIVGATWPEMDLHTGVWTIPASRMKAGREHRVPLPASALALLDDLHQLRDRAAGDHVFPGGKKRRPLSTMAMAMVLRRMERGDLTVHGFRSTFRDWCAEATNFPRDLAEQALAHSLTDKVEAAYRRGDALDKRRRLMQSWADFCARPAMAGTITPHSRPREGARA